MDGSNYFKGTCLSMCPKGEIMFRETNGLLHYFEMDHTSKNEAKIDERKVVKEFSRSAAGKKQVTPEDLRPSHILLRTVQYLINEIVPQTVLPWLTVYDFVNDRLQAIRQDLTIQMIEDENSVQIFEKCVRFYITASYLLCEQPQMKFDQHLNHLQLSICIEKLFTLYKKFKSKNLFEFIAVYYSQNILNPEIFYRSTLVFSGFFSNSLVKHSISVCNAYQTGNFVNFFKQIIKSPLIILLSYFTLFPEIRKQALAALCTAYTSNTCQLPINVICSWLSLANKHDLVALLQDCNVKLDGDNVCFNRKIFKKPEQLLLKKEVFIEKELKKHSLSNIINGAI